MKISTFQAGTIKITTTKMVDLLPEALTALVENV